MKSKIKETWENFMNRNFPGIVIKGICKKMEVKLPSKQNFKGEDIKELGINIFATKDLLFEELKKKEVTRLELVMLNHELIKLKANLMAYNIVYKQEITRKFNKDKWDIFYKTASEMLNISMRLLDARLDVLEGVK